MVLLVQNTLGLTDEAPAPSDVQSPSVSVAAEYLIKNINNEKENDGEAQNERVSNWPSPKYDGDDGLRKIRRNFGKEKEKNKREAFHNKTSDWSVRTDQFDWASTQSQLLINYNEREAESASNLIDNQMNNNNINIPISFESDIMADYSSTFTKLIYPNTTPVADRTRSKSRSTVQETESPPRPRSSSVDSSTPSAEKSSVRTTAQIIEAATRVQEKLASFNGPFAVTSPITVNTLLTPQSSGANVFGSSLTTQVQPATQLIMSSSLTATDLAKALGSQNILSARNECQNAVAKAPLSSKKDYDILAFLRTLKETLLKFVDSTGNSGLPYTTLDQAFVDGVTQSCFIGEAASIFSGLIKTNPPKVTFDSFATAIKALYCSGLTDQTILGNASFFRWNEYESPADASLRLAMSLNSLSTSPNQSEVKRFFIYGCRDVYKELHERLLTFQHHGKSWTDVSVSLDDIVQYCNIKCKHLWSNRQKDSDLLTKMNNLEVLLMNFKQPSVQPVPAPTKSYDRPKRSIINYAHSIGIEPESPADFQTVMNIFTTNVGVPTEEEIADFQCTRNLVLNAFNRHNPPYANGVPNYGRSYPVVCFVCDKPGHRSNECDLLAFAKSIAGTDSFQKWKDDHNKGMNYIFPTQKLSNTPLKAVTETVSLVDNSDVSLSDLDLTISFSNKNLLDEQIPETFVFDTLKVSSSAHNAADNSAQDLQTVLTAVETDLSIFSHYESDKSHVNLPVSPSKDDALVDIISTSPVDFDLNRPRGKPTVL